MASDASTDANLHSTAPILASLVGTNQEPPTAQGVSAPITLPRLLRIAQLLDHRVHMCIKPIRGRIPRPNAMFH